ncbi:MAG TPA: FAD-dependent oxidoreductase [Pseudonocardiaceae bacterium]|jgi:2-polyprenyl-6-methoxyphenol hydroxylase-like FAD-dependent oxidoreductase
MKVVICGAGIAGLTLAHRLDTLGWDVVLLEKASGPRTQGYMIDFFGIGYDAAEAMGVLPRLTELGYHIEEMSFLDETGRRRAGAQVAGFVRAMGGRMLSIMRPDLELALRELLSATVDLRFATSLRHVDADPDGVRVTLSDGSTLEADLLVGADGIHSTVRRLVFGEEPNFLRYLGFHTAAFTFDDPLVLDEVHDRFCLTDTTGRQMGFYALRDGTLATYTVHRTPDPTLPDDAQAAVRRAYGTLGWIAPRALAHCPPADQVYYDQVAQIEMPQWSQGRVALVGDACQAVSLLAGQGAALGIAGSYVLADQLTTADSIEAGLRRYEQLMRPVVEDKQQTARKAARWFCPEAAWQLRVRRVAMKLSNVPGISRLVTATVTGKSATTIKELHAAGGRATRSRPTIS